MSEPVPITDLKCLAQFSEEQANGTYANVQRMADLRDVFHPLQDPNDKAPATNFMVKLDDGSIVDLNELFEPLANGKECAISTDFEVNGTDLQQIFAGINTIPVDLELQQLPAGAFNCSTRVRVVYDTSGSMNTALGYIRPAVATLLSWFSKTFNFSETQSYPADTSQGGVAAYNTSDEFVYNWLAEDLGGDDNNTEILIGYINESNSRGPGSLAGYTDRWIVQQAAGGHRHGAIMGVVPFGGGYASEILRGITATQANGKAANEMGVSAFFDFNQTTPSSYHVALLADYFNIPTKPQDVSLGITAFESDTHYDKVQWNVTSQICGLTQKIQGDSIVPSQSSWKYEIFKGDPGFETLIDTQTHSSIQNNFVYMADDHKMDTDFYLRVTLVGVNGESDKVSELILCKKQPVFTRPRPSDRFEVGGEGGYCWNTFVFQAKDKVFTRNTPWTKARLPERHTVYTDCSGNQWHVNHGVIRSADGNYNQCCLYIDGMVNFKGKLKHDQWIQDNFPNMKDTFLPSSYGSAGYQYILLDNGDLIAYIASQAGTSQAIKTIMSGVNEIMAVNQAHNEDIIVSTHSDQVWHVAPGVYAPVVPYATRIQGLLASEVLCITVGDNNDTCVVVKTDEPDTVYRIKTTNEGLRHNTQHATLSSVEACPHPGVRWVTKLLSSDETIVDAVAQEFHLVLLTTKRIYTMRPTSSADTSIGNRARAWWFDLPAGFKSARCLGATAYTVAVELDGIPYMISYSGYNGMNGYMPSSSCANDAYHPLDKCQPMCDYDKLIGEVSKIHRTTTGLAAIETQSEGSALNVCDTNYTCPNDLVAYNWKQPNILGLTDGATHESVHGSSEPQAFFVNTSTGSGYNACEPSQDSFTRLASENSREPYSLPQAFEAIWGIMSCSNSYPRVFGLNGDAGKAYVLTGSDRGRGNIMPLDAFYLDDPGFIIPPFDDDKFSISTLFRNPNPAPPRRSGRGGFPSRGGGRPHNHLNLPTWRTIMVVNNYTSLMGGAIDGHRRTTYYHNGKSFTHGDAAASSVASQLRGIDVPVIAYTDLSIPYLIRLGFRNDKGEFACRFLHDGQGCGGMGWSIKVPAYE